LTPSDACCIHILLIVKNIPICGDYLMKPHKPNKFISSSFLSLFLVSVISIGFMTALPVMADQTVVVNGLGDSPNDMNITLRSAIDHANSIYPEKLIVDLTGLSGTITLTCHLPILTCNIELIGPGKDHLTIDGDRKYRVFLFNGSECKIKDITVSKAFYQGGSSTGSAGGGAGLGSALLVNRGTVVCENVRFYGNHTIGGNGNVSFLSGISNPSDAVGGAYGESVVGGVGGRFSDPDVRLGGDGGTFAGGGCGWLCGGAGGYGGGGGAGYWGADGGPGGLFGGEGGDGGGGGGGAGLGGAVFINAGASIQLVSCMFDWNEASGGRALEDPRSFPFDGSDGEGKGGAIFVMEGATANMKDLTFKENTAFDGTGYGFTPGDHSDTEDVYGTMKQIIGDPPYDIDPPLTRVNHFMLY
jgi:hypothetical protein